MESRAPVSSTCRARVRRCGEVEGVGSRALRARRVRLAFERREAIFSGGGGGLEFNCESREERVEIDADMMEIVVCSLGFCGMYENRSAIEYSSKERCCQPYGKFDGEECASKVIHHFTI